VNIVEPENKIPKNKTRCLSCGSEFVRHPMRPFEDTVTSCHKCAGTIGTILSIIDTKNTDTLSKLLPRVLRNKDGKVVETAFNIGRIRASLMQETSLDEGTIGKVIRVWCVKYLPMNLKTLTGPEIREQVCGLLDEMGHRDARCEYTRIGMPIADFEAILSETSNTGERMARVYDRISFEYNEMKKLKERYKNE